MDLEGNEVQNQNHVQIFQSGYAGNHLHGVLTIYLQLHYPKCQYSAGN
jgi:hypothetical protein